MIRSVRHRTSSFVALFDPRRSRGYTLVELLIVIAIVGLLSSLVIVNVLPRFAKARQDAVVLDLRAIDREIAAYLADHGELPDSLSDMFDPVPTDPWGNEYRYLRIDGGSAPPGHRRKDRFLVPLNDDYDLYSMGPDGKSSPPLTANHSRDDIIRAANGSFIGPASEY